MNRIRLEKGMELENDIILQTMENKQADKELEVHEEIEEKKIEVAKQKPKTQTK
jgi:hypothetical protein